MAGGNMNEYETHLKRGEETDVKVHISGWCISHLNCKSMDVIAQLLAFWCTNHNTGLIKFNCCHRGTHQQQFAVPPKTCKKWNVGSDSQMCMEEKPESKDSWTFHFIWQVNWLLAAQARRFIVNILASLTFFSTCSSGPPQCWLPKNLCNCFLEKSELVSQCLVFPGTEQLLWVRCFSHEKRLNITGQKPRDQSCKRKKKWDRVRDQTSARAAPFSHTVHFLFK